ncbi:hypothetical protein PQX77_013656 [Marasmius sp. AFHP31]|nr:hypothetical protein PQX77_013656 [Marasmius sp. AFHP31]
MVARPTLQTQTVHAPTSFQDFLPSTSIASPDSSNGHSPSSTKMKKSPSSATRHSPPPPLPEKALPTTPALAPTPASAPPTSSRARFAQMARSAVGSFRSSKNQSKTPKVDPTAAALQWVESATASRNVNASPSSSAPPREHAPNNPRSHVSPTHSHHSDKAQSASGQGQFTRQNTTRNRRTPKHLRIVRFKEEEEFIPSPPWTPSSLESSFEDLHLQPGNSSNTSSHMEEADDDEPFTWEDLIDEEEEKITQANARPNKALAMAAALERPPVPRSRREGLRVVPPLPPAMLATVS